MDLRWSCDCGHEQPIKTSEITLGSTVQCGGCEKVRACVKSPHGGFAWVTIETSDVEAYDLLANKTDKEFSVSGPIAPFVLSVGAARA